MKIAVIGGGASGLACAIEAARQARIVGTALDITVFEKNDRVGKKILSTGNGRCNMTNAGCDISDYFGDTDFAAYALECFDAKSTVEFFASMGLYCRTDSEGRVYPLSNQASGVLDALRFECERLKVKTVCSQNIEKIAYDEGKYIINDRSCFDSVVFACGSASSVRDFNGYRLLSSLGYKITDTVPSLTRLKVNSPLTRQLKGIRAFVKMSLILDGKETARASGELLFGDNCLSGIVSMQLSAYAAHYYIKKKRGFSVRVDFVPDFSLDELEKLLCERCMRAGETACENLLTGFMPKKIGMVILKECKISASDKISSLSAKQLRALAYLCKGFEFETERPTSFSDSQVSAGGLCTNQFERKTLESKKHRGLYACGEVLDVDGLCGGFNLQWAWSSGRLCAKSIVSGAMKSDKNK